MFCSGFSASALQSCRSEYHLPASPVEFQPFSKKVLGVGSRSCVSCSLKKNLGDHFVRTRLSWGTWGSPTFNKGHYSHQMFFTWICCFSCSAEPPEQMEIRMARYKRCGRWKLMARYVRFPPRMESVSHQPGQHCLHQGNGCLEVLHHPDNRKPFLEVEHRQLQSRLTSWITAFNAGRSKTIFKRTQWCGSFSILWISCMDIFRCSSTVWISLINTMFPIPIPYFDPQK